MSDYILQLTAAEIQIVISALYEWDEDASQALYKQICASRSAQDDVKARAAAALEAKRAVVRDRIANHKLTKRQAQTLAAIRAGKSVHQIPYAFRRPDGIMTLEWTWQKYGGGAARRMVELMAELGLLIVTQTPGSYKYALSEEGVKQLLTYEAKRGLIGRLPIQANTGEAANA